MHKNKLEAWRSDCIKKQDDLFDPFDPLALFDPFVYADSQAVTNERVKRAKRVTQKNQTKITNTGQRRVEQKMDEGRTKAG